MRFLFLGSVTYTFSKIRRKYFSLLYDLPLWFQSSLTQLNLTCSKVDLWFLAVSLSYKVIHTFGRFFVFFFLFSHHVIISTKEIIQLFWQFLVALHFLGQPFFSLYSAVATTPILFSSKHHPFKLLGLCNTFPWQQLNKSHAEIPYSNSVNQRIKQRIYYRKLTRLNMIYFTLTETLSFKFRDIYRQIAQENRELYSIVAVQ